jgi:hypothetical protein
MINRIDLEKIIIDDLSKVISIPIIYHYTDFNTCLNKILSKQTLKFSNPDLFNDPFDCNEYFLKFEMNDVLIDETLRHFPVKLSNSDKKLLQEKFKDGSANAIVLKEEKKKYKLSCFSEICDEVLMWSHNADKHNGICIGFNFPYKYEDKFILCPVKYIDKIIPLDGQSDTYRTLVYWLTTKSIRWNYEKEIRAIANAKSTDTIEYINFDKKYVKEIVFGCKVSKEEADNAINIIDDLGFNRNEIIFKRMIIDKDTFLLKEEIILGT